MNLYSELLKLEDDKEHLSLLTDDLLDLYKTYPKECKRLLLELDNISKEFDSIEKELREIS